MPDSPPDDAVQVTLRVEGRPVAHHVARPGEAILPHTPVEMRVRRAGAGFVLAGPDGETSVAPGASASLQRGGFSVDVEPVRRFRLPRFSRDQGDMVLPSLIVAIALLVVQVELLWLLLASLFASGAAGFEPTPEFLARLLRGEHAGEEVGVLAPIVEARPRGDAIESFYLPSGHLGPATAAGGGRNVGRRIAIGNPDPAPAGAAAPGVGGDQDIVTPTLDAENDGLADADITADEAPPAEQPVAVHVTEGWGLSDWYDTEDARKDAREIEEQLRMAHRILRIDPDHPDALMVRSYYEYLAMDFSAAQATYDKFTRLYPDEPAGWNNLALIYKRRGEYVKEEELYRIALQLAPDDDHALNNLAVNLAHQGRYEEAVAIMEKLEKIIPGDAYADLHRAKIYAAWSKEERAYHYLQKSLAGMRKLDTLHNIEFRQDIRVDPAFETMRGQERFRNMLNRFYGDDPAGWWQRVMGQ